MFDTHIMLFRIVSIPPAQFTEHNVNTAECHHRIRNSLYTNDHDERAACIAYLVQPSALEIETMQNELLVHRIAFDDTDQPACGHDYGNVKCTYNEAEVTCHHCHACIEDHASDWGAA
jgi:hypothetical protein